MTEPWLKHWNAAFGSMSEVKGDVKQCRHSSARLSVAEDAIITISLSTCKGHPAFKIKSIHSISHKNIHLKKKKKLIHFT